MIAKLIQSQVTRQGVSSIAAALYNWRMSHTIWHCDEAFYFRRLKEEVRKEIAR